MKRIIAVLLAMSLLLVLFAGYHYDPNKRYTLAALQEDLSMLQTLEKENHPYYFSDKNERAEIYKKQASLLKDGMTELEFYKVLSPIIKSLNCGHSYMKFSKNLENYSVKHGNYLPLQVKVIENKAYVLKDQLSEGIPAGSEIIEINGKATKEIIAVFLDNIASDGANETFKYFKINRDFNKLFFTYFDNTKEFDIKYISLKDSKVMEAKLAAVSLDKLTKKPTSKQEAAESKQPKLEINEKGNYAVLTISSFDFYNDYDRALFDKIIDNYFIEIKNSNISNLIMDFRGNIGGAPYGAAHILTYLAKEPVPYFAETEATSYFKALVMPMPLAENRFTGNVYTLIDGGCFSTTSHLCALLKYHKIGVFIGEETGGSFACSDGSGDAVLKNTKLIAHGSTQVYTTAVEGLPIGRGIMPDYPVVPAINDYIENKDIVKQFAIDLLSKK